MTKLLTTASLLDNGIGMFWSKFAGGSKDAWKDHSISTFIQVPLLIGQKKLAKLNNFIPVVLLIISLIFECRGWFRNFRAFLKK